jgi:hypothetical protein
VSTERGAQMGTWLRRIRGAIAMGVIWGLGWGLGGLTIGVASRLFPGLPWWDTFFKYFDAPLPALALPGFLAGMFFSVVVGIAGRRRRFSELSIRSFALWGAVGGVFVTFIPAMMVGVGLGSLNIPTREFLTVLTVAAVPAALLSSTFAAGYLAIARRAELAHQEEPALSR